MHSAESALVDIARDFLAACVLAGRVAERYRARELRFEEVQQLVGDGDDAALFRLKERCHALFRGEEKSGGAPASREAFFDLAVGALFHEAMKFRENFYQQSVYGPKIRALRRDAEPGEAALFEEFEKILGATSLRLDEALMETESLLEHTRIQFRRLLVAHPENGLVTRYLVEQARLVEEVFGEGLDALLSEIHGSAGAAYLRAARSYLASGYFAKAQGALDEVERRQEAPGQLAGLRAYAAGMGAYLDGRHGEALEGLAAWLDGDAAAMAEPLADLAFAALARIASSAQGDDGELVARTRVLAERVAPLSPRARSTRPPSDVEAS